MPHLATDNCGFQPPSYALCLCTFPINSHLSIQTEVLFKKQTKNPPKQKNKKQKQKPNKTGEMGGVQKQEIKDYMVEKTHSVFTAHDNNINTGVETNGTLGEDTQVVD